MAAGQCFVNQWTKPLAVNEAVVDEADFHLGDMKLPVISPIVQ